MKEGLKAAIGAAIAFLLTTSASQAQSFEQLTRDGTAAFRSGDMTRALEIRLRQLSMRAPHEQDHCFVYWGLYTAYTLGTGEMDKGLKAVDDSIECLNAIPDNSRDMLEFREEALRYRAMALRDWRRYDEALAAVDAMTRLRPDRATAHETTRGNILDAKGDYDGAAAAYRRAAQDDRNGTWLRYGAWMRVKQQNFDLALSELARINRDSPYVPGKSNNMYAWILAEQGKYDAAAAELSKDERADGANAAAHAYLRGYVEAARGNFSAAAAAFRPGAAANANNANVQVALYLAQARAGNGSTAALTALSGQLTPTKWPDAQVFYVVGKIDRSALASAASFGNLRIEQSRLCRMNFVTGEMALIKGDLETAKADLARAVELCVLEPAAQERTWAKGELARLAVDPAPKRSEAPPAASTGGDTCAAATAHWTSAESIGTRAAYEDHLVRFPDCAFANLAAARIIALDRTGSDSRPARPAACPAGMSRDGDGDCLRNKVERKPAQRRTVSRAPSERGEGRPTLDCTNPAGLMACANRALSTLPTGQ